MSNSTSYCKYIADITFDLGLQYPNLLNISKKDLKTICHHKVTLLAFSNLYSSKYYNIFFPTHTTVFLFEDPDSLHEELISFRSISLSTMRTNSEGLFQNQISFISHKQSLLSFTNCKFCREYFIFNSTEKINMIDVYSRCNIENKNSR